MDKTEETEIQAADRYINLCVIGGYDDVVLLCEKLPYKFIISLEGWEFGYDFLEEFEANRGYDDKDKLLNTYI